MKEINTATLQLSLTADSLTADLETPANASDPNLATLAVKCTTGPLNGGFINLTTKIIVLMRCNLKSVFHIEK